MRPILAETSIEPNAIKTMEKFHFEEIVKPAQDAVAKNEWVIIGMTGNPFVPKAKNHLDSKNIKFTYIGHGSYMSGWKKRLAIKLWTGWPTFPQVFHKGKLIGGFTDLKNYLPLIFLFSLNSYGEQNKPSERFFLASKLFRSINA